MKLLKIMTAVYAAVKSVWTRGSPFAAFSALWPTNPEGKYVIQAEGIRLALTNHGVAPANLWINNSRGEEIDIILGLDDAAGYRSLPFNPFLNGVIGVSAPVLVVMVFKLSWCATAVISNDHHLLMMCE